MTHFPGFSVPTSHNNYPFSRRLVIFSLSATRLPLCHSATVSPYDTKKREIRPECCVARVPKHKSEAREDEESRENEKKRQNEEEMNYAVWVERGREKFQTIDVYRWLNCTHARVFSISVALGVVPFDRRSSVIRASGFFFIAAGDTDRSPCRNKWRTMLPARARGWIIIFHSFAYNSKSPLRRETTTCPSALFPESSPRVPPVWFTAVRRPRACCRFPPFFTEKRDFKNTLGPCAGNLNARACSVYLQLRMLRIFIYAARRAYRRIRDLTFCKFRTSY